MAEMEKELLGGSHRLLPAGRPSAWWQAGTPFQHACSFGADERVFQRGWLWRWVVIKSSWLKVSLEIQAEVAAFISAKPGEVFLSAASGKV